VWIAVPNSFTDTDTTGSGSETTSASRGSIETSPRAHDERSSVWRKHDRRADHHRTALENRWWRATSGRPLRCGLEIAERQRLQWAKKEKKIVRM